MNTCDCVTADTGENANFFYHALIIWIIYGL